MYKNVAARIEALLVSYKNILPTREDGDMEKTANMHEHQVFNKMAEDLNTIVSKASQNACALVSLKEAMTQIAFMINSEYTTQEFGFMVSSIYDDYDEVVGCYDDNGRMTRAGAISDLKYRYEKAVAQKIQIREEHFYYKVVGRVRRGTMKLSLTDKKRFDAIEAELAQINKDVLQYIHVRFYVKPLMEAFMSLWAVYDEAIEVKRLEKAKGNANNS